MYECQGRHKGQTAVILGNGWSLAQYVGWRVKEGVVGIGVNRSWEVMPTLPYHVHIDRSAAPPDWYEGIRFGAERPGVQQAKIVGVFWSDEWKRLGMLLPNTSPPFSGLYAIEVAVFLGCREIYLVGFDGNNRHGTHSEGHFYPGRTCPPSLAHTHTKWMSAVMHRHGDIHLHQTNALAEIQTGSFRPATDVLEQGDSDGNEDRN
jgi:hypothetical protein